MIIIQSARLVPAGFHAITLWPFVFAVPGALTPALRAHEAVHWRRQMLWAVVALLLGLLVATLGGPTWAWLPAPLAGLGAWWGLYAGSKAFRWAEEAVAHRAEVAAGGDSYRCAYSLLRYGTGRTLDDAFRALSPPPS